MQERPVVVKEGGGSSVAMFGILAIVVIAAIALFVWQPWNTSSSGHTTTVNVQPGAAGGASSGGSAAGSSSGGSSSGGSSGSSSSSGSKP